MFTCPACSLALDAPDLAGQYVACPRCHQQFYAPHSQAVQVQPPPPPPVFFHAGQSPPAYQAGYPQQYSRPNNGMPTAAAVLLSFFFPGLGQLCQGRVNPGIGFLVAFLVGCALTPVLIGLPIVLIAWVWSMIDAAAA